MSIVTANKPLPLAFTSLYRLVLRAAGASVLHHPAQTRQLRRLFRPTFQEAAKVIRKLEKQPSDQQHLSEWLELWQTRVDSTLSVLATSSSSRGLSHNLTRNIATILRNASFANPKRKFNWNPKLAPDSKAYQPKPLASFAKDRESQAYSNDAFGALGEVIMMAEGRHGILLGRVRSSGTNDRAWNGMDGS
ncbi:hypothetical protein BXZ70DRAFT_738438 [Cristinia sonorae]|uniref:Uncharacterized protein n=1 Tax=Cristinia sonorae TaxID=1940300 RepID=A0A8K0XSI4_9AGAR|nr:hypothetical protein BXZ70DRAFT_738438 [Cristinia sonorae]